MNRIILTTMIASFSLMGTVNAANSPSPDSTLNITINSPHTTNVAVPDCLKVSISGQSSARRDTNWEIILASIISVVGLGLSLVANKQRERGNIIRQARISWIQDLRKNISLLPLESEKISLEFGLLMKTKLSKFPTGEPDAIKLVDDFIKQNIESLSKIEGYCHLVVLHLNPRSDESGKREHEKLEKLILNLAANISYDGLYLRRIDLNALCSEIMNEAREVIKSSWEQAKQ